MKGMRYLLPFIEQDLKRKMVFLAGPRQVGKTTLALSFLGADATETHPAYLNWDRVGTRKPLVQGMLPPEQGLVILDEIHKYREWKNLIKGFYDTEKSTRKFLVTGSAMLNVYRRGQDSLLGRYHYYRLHPFSLVEARQVLNVGFGDLLKFGGFPEPLLSGSERVWRRWNKERIEKIIYEDIRDLESVKTLEKIELLADELPRRVGSPLSVKSLSEDIQKAPATIENWVTILEKVFFCFRIPPYGAPRVRAVKKEQKLYLWDWSTIESPGVRFENLVASHLLKYCHFLEDTEGYRMELRFLRDTDGRELDFVVLKDKKPLFAVECKTGEKQVSSRIGYFRERTPIPHFYQVHTGAAHYGNSETTGEVIPFEKFCLKLKIP